jgi:adenosylhomocysteine nucleosidase
MKPRSWITVLSLTLLILCQPIAALAQPRIGVLGIADEIAPVEKRLRDMREVVVRGYVFRVGMLDGQPAVVGRCGTGKVNAAIVATLIIDHFDLTALFFSGTAGAIDPALRPGDVVIGATVAQHDIGIQTATGIIRRGPRNIVTGEREPLLFPAPDLLLTAARRATINLTLPRIKMPDAEHVPRITEGVIATGDVFMADPTRREELRASLGAAAVEMEGAAVVQTCRQFALPCLVIRSITDGADLRAMASYQEFRATASENAAAVVTAIIRQLAGKTVIADR